MIDVYMQYFEAKLCFNGVDRHAAIVKLIADSCAGNIRYEAAVSFFPHNDPQDFSVSYDAYFPEVLFEGKGRRSKKREVKLLETVGESFRRLAEQAGGEIHLDKPLTGPSYDSLIKNEIYFELPLDKS